MSAPTFNSYKPAEKLRNVHVMILNSSPKAAELIKGILNQLGFPNIRIVSDGYQGVKELQNGQIDIIFVDTKLKVYKNRDSEASEMEIEKNILPISGTDFVKRLRHAPNSPRPFIPVVMLIENAQMEAVQSALESGVNEIIVSPINAQQFYERFVSVVKSPRIFVTADTYKGPCRRRKTAPPPANLAERRVREIRLMRS